MAISTRFSKGMQGSIRLNQIKIRAVETEAEKDHWNQLICEHHYLHDATLCGRQIRYLAECRGKCVALISFGTSSWHLAGRDQWIGWDEHQRLSRLNFVLQNSRFLVMPGVDTPNLASKVLSLCQKRLPGDWLECYNQPILLLETFVERCYPGTSYRADNWIRLGQTRGFSRCSTNFYRLNEAPKTLWVKELRPGAAQILSSVSLPADLAPFERKLDSDEQARVFTSKALESLYDVFNALPDPRRRAGRRHSLACCLSIVACGFLVGCEGLAECTDFGRELKPAQMRALRMFQDRNRNYKAPCHNTLWRIFSLIDPMEFERLIEQWCSSGVAEVPTAFALDGKTLCGSLDEEGNALHVVSAVAHECSSFFFQTTTNNKGREGEAARNLIVKMPDLQGSVITADALHLQDESIAQVVEDKNGHVLVGLKGNRGRLLNEVTVAFEKSDLAQQARDSDVSFGHGRIERRIANVIPFQTAEKYPYLSTAIRIDRTRIQKKDDHTSRTTSYYVGTFQADQFTAAQVQGLVRGHWVVENKLHHVKDRTMQEDRCQARANVGTNMALLRSVVSQIKARAKIHNKRVSGKLRGNAAYALELVMQPIDYQHEKRIE